MNYAPLLDQIASYDSQIQALLHRRRLLLCMGDPAVLTLMAARSRPWGQLVGAVTTAGEARTLTEQEAPSLVVLSDQLAEGDAYALLDWVLGCPKPVQVLLMISQIHRRQAIHRAIRNGCDGLVLQTRFGSGALLTALQAISQGGIYVDRALHPTVRNLPGRSGPLQPLTEREREVLQALAAGASNQEVGEQLYLAADTVKTHLASILRKMPARNRTHAAVLGLRWGLID